jgi:serine/threonine protein phosphatase PrpC
VTCCNVGDSAAVLVQRVNGTGRAAALSTDHRLDRNVSEQHRVAAAGGIVARLAGARAPIPTVT